jgi:hypothetical protein
MEQIREVDALPYLRLKQKMQNSDCLAILKDGRRLDVFIYQNKPAFQIDRQFFFADTHPEFVRFEKKPLAAPLPEPVQLVNEPEVKDEVVDNLGQRLRAQLLRNPDVIYKRNLLRQTFGNLEVKEYLGVGQSDSLTRYWYCLCKAHGRYIVATQAELVTETVTDCNNARAHTEKIVFRGAQLV